MGPKNAGVSALFGEVKETPRSDARWEALLAAYGKLLRHAIGRFCPARLRAQLDDIEQEARLRLWRTLRRESDIVNPASYLYRVAATATLDAVRRANAVREDPVQVADAAGSDSPERTVDERLRLARVESAMARLGDAQKEVLGLHLQGFTTSEIGLLLGWAEPKARSRVYRALHTLRAHLQSEGIQLKDA